MGDAGDGRYKDYESTTACRTTLLREKLKEIDELAGKVFTVGLKAFQEAASTTFQNVGQNASCQVEAAARVA